MLSWVLDHIVVLLVVCAAVVVIVRWFLRPPSWKDGEGSTGLEEITKPPGLP